MRTLILKMPMRIAPSTWRRNTRMGAGMKDTLCGARGMAKAPTTIKMGGTMTECGKAI